MTGDGALKVLDHPERVKAAYRGELAAQMVGVAIELACLVRDHDRETIGEFLAALTEEERTALLVVQAAMIPVDRPAADLLSWVTWDENLRPLPGPVTEDPAPRRRNRRKLKPCGTYAAYCRHKDHGELIDDACDAAAKEYWLARKRDRTAGSQPDLREAAQAEYPELRDPQAAEAGDERAA